jgi:hypothetical protein
MYETYWRWCENQDKTAIKNENNKFILPLKKC